MKKYADQFIRISGNISVLVKDMQHVNMNTIISMVRVDVEDGLQSHQINDNHAEATRNAKYLHILCYALVWRIHLE